MKSRSAGLALVFVLSGFPLAAQDRQWISSGDQVRITSSVYSGEAVVVQADRDALELGVLGLGFTVDVPVESVGRLEVRVRRTGREGARRGALWGLLAGAAGGAFGDSPENQEGFWNSSAGVVLGMTMMGGGIGALIGAARPGSRWEEVALPEPAVVQRPRESVLLASAPFVAASKSLDAAGCLDFLVPSGVLAPFPECFVPRRVKLSVVSHWASSGPGRGEPGHCRSRTWTWYARAGCHSLR